MSVYGSLGCSLCDRLDDPESPAESVFPKPVAVAARGLRDLTKIQAHKSALKRELPRTPHVYVCVCARFCTPQTNLKI